MTQKAGELSLYLRGETALKIGSIHSDWETFNFSIIV